MSTLTKPNQFDNIVYPESDGKPMAENTKQYDWIVTIKENLDKLLPNAFVAADLFWYPVQGQPKIVQAPDTMVAIGRPKGPRGSYRQWEEDNIAPQCVFEILSPSNTALEMARKLSFYDRHGVAEYYVYDPDTEKLSGYIRKEANLQVINDLAGWISPVLGIRFEPKQQGLEIYFPDGERFLTVRELHQEREQAQKQAQKADQQAEQERQRAEQEHQRANAADSRAKEADQRAERLAEKLRAMGIDPDSV